MCLMSHKSASSVLPMKALNGRLTDLIHLLKSSSAHTMRIKLAFQCQQMLSEGIEICFGTLRANCGLQDFIVRVLQNPQSWQLVEAALYCTRAVAKPLMAAITGGFADTFL